MIEDKDGTLLSICKNVQLHKEAAEKFRLQMEQATDEATRQHYEQEMHKMLEMAGLQKKKLPIFCFAATFKDGKRTNANAKPNGLVLIDIDGLENPLSEYDRLLKADWGFMSNSVVLVYTTPSGHGLRIVYKGIEGMDYVQNMHWFGEHFDVQIDESCKDFARCSFAVPYSYIKFVSDSLFTYNNDQIFTTGSKGLAATPSSGNINCDGNNSGNSVPDNQGSEGTALVDSGESAESVILNQLEKDDNGNYYYRGIPFDSIIRTFLEYTGGPIVVGERNTRLHRLAINLRYILDNDENAVATIIQPFANGLSTEEVRTICHSACGNSQQPVFPKALQRVLSQLGTQKQGGGTSTAIQEDGIDYGKWNAEIAKIAFPPSIAASLSGVPEDVKMGALLVTLPLVYTLLSRIAYKFYDGQWYRLSGQTYVVGDAASGKSFMTQLSTAWLSPIRVADTAGREQIRKWKQLKVQKGQGKMDTPKPTPCIRIVPTQASIATILERMFYAVEKDVPSLDGLTTFNRHLHIVTVETEIATLIRMLKSNFAQFLDIMVKAFQDEKVGVDYQNQDSINAIFNAHWNVVFGGTWTSFWQLCRDVLNGHPLRMMIFPMPDMRFEMLAKGGSSRSVAETTCIKEMSFKLSNPKIQGNIISQNLNNEMWKWCDNEAHIAEELNDTIRDIVRRRAALIGLRAGIAFSIIENVDTFADIKPESNKENEWYRPLKASKDAIRFAKMIADFCSEVQYKVFAKPMLEKMNEVSRVGSVRKKASVNDDFYEMLPERFTSKEVAASFNLTDNNLKKRLQRLKNLGKLAYDSRKHCYIKIKK